jgi:aspartate/methionine/tyrosine aminotransferase
MPGCFTTLDLTVNAIEQTRQRIATTAGYLDLTSSNPTHQGLLFPADILRAAAERYWSTRRYDPDPRGLPEARAAIAADYTHRIAHTQLHHPTVTTSPHIIADHIFLTASTSEAYGLLFALLTDAGDNVLAPDVTYPLFDFLAEIHHIELRPYHMDETRNWQIDADSLLAQADSRTRAVLLISPHNPTGAVLHTPLAAFEQLGVPLICDEVFATFPYGQASIPVATTLHPTLPVLHLNGISKRFALPDLKLGWIAANSVAYAAYGERLQLINDTYLGASSLVQTMLPYLFEHAAPFVAAMQAHITANITYALERFATCPAITLRPPDGGYYLFPAVRGWDNEEELVLWLLEQVGVLVHPGYYYGDVGGTHIMLSALTERQQFVEGVERIAPVLG